MMSIDVIVTFGVFMRFFVKAPFLLGSKLSVKAVANMIRQQRLPHYNKVLVIDYQS